ncbi:MAG: FecR domain-containing protein [Spirochaetales bacterium]|nr:FecR domain-containing protein [Spirochaetales bacterium]
MKSAGRKESPKKPKDRAERKASPRNSRKKDEKKPRKMPGFVKYSLFVLAGAAVALLLLGLYSWFIDPYQGYGEPESLPPVKISGKDVFITGVSGEVYIIRNNRMISAGIGDSLKEGDVLKVVDQSYCQIQFSDRGTAGLDSNTVMLMKKLVNAQKDMQIRTEVLMGSMLYRVNRLSENDEFQVESEGVLYDVKGTDFLVMRAADGVLLAVKEGTVRYSVDGFERDNPPVRTGEQVFIANDDREGGTVYPLGESAALRLENLRFMSPISVESGSWPVSVMIETSPPGADIYLDGRKIASHIFSGLFDVGTKLDFLIRKRGYVDKALHIEVKAAQDKIYLVELDPADLEETMMEREETQSFEGILNRMKKEYEQDLKEQQTRFDGEIYRRENRIQELSEQNESVTREKDDLSEELLKKQQEISDLRKLMTQIQELSNQQ